MITGSAGVSVGGCRECRVILGCVGVIHNFSLTFLHFLACLFGDPDVALGRNVVTLEGEGRNVVATKSVALCC